jgi:exonuclease VII small subunit
MTLKLLDALHTWQEAEATARQLDQSLAWAVARLDRVRAAQAAQRLRDQRAFADEMRYTLLQLLPEREPPDST